MRSLKKSTTEERSSVGEFDKYHWKKAYQIITGVQSHWLPDDTEHTSFRTPLYSWMLPKISAATLAWSVICGVSFQGKYWPEILKPLLWSPCSLDPMLDEVGRRNTTAASNSANSSSSESSSDACVGVTVAQTEGSSSDSSSALTPHMSNDVLNTKLSTKYPTWSNAEYQDTSPAWALTVIASYVHDCTSRSTINSTK